MTDATRKRGVIFDMDGVLVDSGPAHCESWRVLARQHGLEISDDQFANSFGQTSRDIIRALWGPATSDADIRRHDDEKEAIYRKLVTGRVPVMAGAGDMLAALSRTGYTLAVATSGPPTNIALILTETGFGRFFAATVSGFDVRHGKPAPDCFVLAAARAGLRAERCVVVEDAPVGIQATVAAGMQPIGLVGTHTAERLRAAGAVRVVTQLAQIGPEVVAELLTED
ncbi:MAG: HAD family phosphatase [Planctomycetes bacterium]|nr:HAD family phosphatase [Planctomycetota bacterium]